VEICCNFNGLIDAVEGLDAIDATFSPKPPGPTFASESRICGAGVPAAPSRPIGTGR